MRYNKVKEFIGKRVEIEFFDGDIKSGTLVLRESESGNNKGWFRIKELCLNFRSSHIVDIRVLDDNNNSNNNKS